MPININDCAKCGCKAEESEVILDGGYRYDIVCSNLECDNAEWDYGSEWVIETWNSKNCSRQDAGNGLSRPPVCPTCLAAMQIAMFHYDGGAEHFWMCHCDEDALRTSRSKWGNYVDNC